MGEKEKSRCGTCSFWDSTVFDGRRRWQDERKVGDVAYRECQAITSYEGTLDDDPVGAFLPDMGDSNWAQSLWTAADFGCSKWSSIDPSGVTDAEAETNREIVSIGA